MTEEEKEAFIQCMEISIDYGENITEEDMKLYNLIIRERKNND